MRRAGPGVEAGTGVESGPSRVRGRVEARAGVSRAASTPRTSGTGARKSGPHRGLSRKPSFLLRLRGLLPRGRED